MSNPITDQILGAWDDDEAPEQLEGVEPVVTDETDQDRDETPSDVVTDDDDEEAPSEEDEEEEAPDDDEELGEEEVDAEASEDEAEEEPAGEETAEDSAFVSDDPQVQAFLAQYDGNIEQALRAAAHQRAAFGRQGQELGRVRERGSELESELEQ